MLKRLTLVACLIALSSSVSAQTVQNPRSVTFTCPDHSQDTGHEIDVVDEASGSVVQTLQGGDPPADGNGNVVIQINVQPIKFGRYTFVVRATAGTIESPDSVKSDVWERSPGPPGKPVAGN